MLLNMFQPNYWLFGNNPKDGSKWDKTQDVTKWGSYIEDGESITGWPKGITNYYVSTNVNNIKIGDIAFFWSFPNFAITTVGYIVSEPYSEDGSFWCDMFLLQIEEKNWISGNYLSKLDEWKNRKPFTYTKKGHLYSQFANPKKISDAEFETIYSELPEHVNNFLSNETLHLSIVNHYEFLMDEAEE